jgi:hypothetical protein
VSDKFSSLLCIRNIVGTNKVTVSNMPFYGCLTMPCFFLMQLRQLCKISGVNVSFDTENARDSFYRATTGFVLDDCSRCVLFQLNFFGFHIT